jgi:hypothetical protein
MTALCHADLQGSPGASASMRVSAQGTDDEQAVRCSRSCRAMEVCSSQLQLEDSELRLPVLTHAPHSAHVPFATRSELTSQEIGMRPSRWAKTEPPNGKGSRGTCRRRRETQQTIMDASGTFPGISRRTRRSSAHSQATPFGRSFPLPTPGTGTSPSATHPGRTFLHLRTLPRSPLARSFSYACYSA